MKKLKMKAEMKTRNVIVAVFVLVALFTVSCSKEDQVVEPQIPSVGTMDIASTLEAISENPESLSADELKAAKIKSKKPKFKNLKAALVKTGLISTVAKNNLTVFAPTDAAFESLFNLLGVNGIEDLTAEQLTPILLYHVVEGEVRSYQLTEGFVPTLNGTAVEIKLDPGVMVNDANVTIADIKAMNGVIHVIDKVLLPPSETLFELASVNPDFSILVQVVEAAGLKDALSGQDQLTVFAPTNEAFAKLLDYLQLPDLQALVDAVDIEGLKSVLLYHVVDGRIYSSDLPAGPLTVTSLNGGTFDIDASTLKITDYYSREASLVPAALNIQATNGVIHVIDEVILPDLGL